MFKAATSVAVLVVIIPEVKKNLWDPTESSAVVLFILNYVMSQRIL